ncbi:pentapeptide repeat-containing protein [Lentzea nigeriaca]
MSPWAMPLVAVAILLLAGAVLTTLWWWVGQQSWTDQEKRTLARLDVVKVASGVALGGGGLFTLYLAARRRRTQEQAQADTNADAEARRITELYAKAVQQLGDAKAPVRLGGLYALERLGQREPETRRTIINVLCAYLRMPYTPPSDRTSRSAGGVRRPLLRDSRRRTGIQAPRGPGASASLVEARLELDVRLTAQRILADHLRPEGDYWGEHDIDLTGAVLVDLEMSDCRVASARFDRASFLGKCIPPTEYTGPARFVEASFAGPVAFSGASFEKWAVFDGASFGGRVWFGGASFASRAMFSGVSFLAADFRDASFSDSVFFAEATFDGGPVADHAGFEDAWVEVNLGTLNSEWPQGWESQLHSR